MTPERWKQVEQLYHSSLKQEPNQRAAFLREACAGDEELQREVESLLAFEQRAESFIEAPPAAALAEAARGMAADPTTPPLTGDIGHYQILSPLGEGGMGVVYKARDKNLGRSVALKVLSAGLVADPEHRKRLVLEARMASALNHPNIVTVHEIARQDGVDFIVMEYVAGKSLDQLIPHQGLPLKEVLTYAIQIADGLATAHAAGIIHRDLKPGNAMVSQSGLVKVLDFGLAKLTLKAASVSSNVSTMPELSSGPRPEEGTLLGTVSYMSPEQAEGKHLDARSDIFSFGLVLYKMVTGQKAFAGESNLAILTAILHEEPKPISQLVPGIPRDLEKIITRCLRKAPGRRWQAMPDLKVTLEELKEESDSGTLAGAAPVVRSARRTWVRVAAAMVVVAIVATGWLFRGGSRKPQAVPEVIPLTSYAGFEQSPSFSTDGNQVAFSWNGEKQDNFDIYIKVIGSGGPLRLTSDPAADLCPAWSPDGRFIAFVREVSTERVAVLLVPALGGPERKLAEAGGVDVAWSPDGNSLAISDKASSNEPVGLFLLSIETGEKRRLTSLPAEWMRDFCPAFSPDGHTLAFSRSTGYGNSDLYLLALSDSGVPMGDPKQLTFDNRGAVGPAWTPDGREIIFASGEVGGRTLWRMPAFDSGKPRRLASVGEVASEPAISRRGGRLAYNHTLLDENIWRLDVDPQGKASPPRSFISSTRVDSCPQFSPNGKRISFASGRSNRSGGTEIWVSNSDGSGAVQLTTMGVGSGFPRWSPDGERIAFDSNAERQFDIYVINANGGRPQRLTSDPSTDAVPSWSGDGKWIYFASDRSGEYQVWKMPSSGGEAAQVTRKGGVAAFESADGKSVYYTKREGPGGLWRVPVRGGGEETEVLTSVARRSFAVVDKGIYFISPLSPGSECSIQFLSFASGKIKPIATIGKLGPSSFTVSPDEQSFLYSQLDLLGGDLMLVENFR